MSIMMVLLLLLEHECANVWLDVMVRSKYCHYYPHYYALFAHMSRYVLFWPHFTPFWPYPRKHPKIPPKQAPDPLPRPKSAIFSLCSYFVRILTPFWASLQKRPPDRPQNHPFLVNFWCFPRVPQIPPKYPYFWPLGHMLHLTLYFGCILTLLHVCYTP